MTDQKSPRPPAHRNVQTGRFARRPVPGVAADSAFDPMGSDIPFRDVSGQASENTIDHPRHAPESDELAPGGPWPMQRSRKPVLVHPDDERTIHGTQGAILRTAARSSSPMEPTAWLVGLGAPPCPVAPAPSRTEAVSDER